MLMLQDNSNHDDRKFILSHIGKPIRKLIGLTQFFNDKWRGLPFFNKKRDIVLRVFSSFCFGYLILKGTNHLSGDYSSYPSQDSKASSFIPSNDYTMASEVQPESYESYQLRILRNQNYLQGEKIKGLREELYEITQKLHELKPHLFKHGDPVDQVKISQLTQLLGEKEETLNHLTEVKEELSHQLSSARKKLNEMETVKEALAAMVDLHRSAKEQHAADFKKQIEEIQLDAELNKSELLRKIEQHEAIQKNLKQELATKNLTSQRLDHLLTQMNLSLTLKEDEILNLEGHILSLYDEILQVSELHYILSQADNRQIQDLVATLDWEKTQTKKLQSWQEEIKWLSDVFIATKEVLLNETEQLKDAINNEQSKTADLIQTNEELSNHKEELVEIIENHERHLEQKSEYIQQLALIVESEKNRNQSLENELTGLLEDQKFADNRINLLETQLNEIDTLLIAKAEELDNANTESELNLATLLSHLDYSEANSKEVQANLEKSLNKHNQTVGTLFSHLDQTEQASTQHLNNYLSLNEKMEKMLEQQKEKENLLQKSLDETYEAYERESERLLQLESLYKESVHYSQLAQMELISRNILLAAKERELETSQTAELEIYRKLSEQILLLEFKHNSEISHAVSLEAMLHESVGNAQHLTQDLRNHQEAFQNKHEDFLALETTHILTKEKLEQQIDEMLNQLQDQKQKATMFEEKFHNMIANYDRASLKAEELEFQIERISQDLEGKTQKLSDLHNKIFAIESENKELLNENQTLRDEIKHQQFAAKDLTDEAHRLSNIVAQMEQLMLEEEEKKVSSLAKMENLLNDQKQIAESKENYISLLMETHDAHKKNTNEKELELNKQLNEMVSKKEEERLKNQKLIEELNLAQLIYNEEHNRSLNLEQALQQNHFEFAELLKQKEENESALNNLDQQIQNLSRSKAQIKSSLSSLYQNKINGLETKLNEKQKLEEELQTALFNYHFSRDKIKKLEEQLASAEQSQRLDSQVDATIRNVELAEENQNLKDKNSVLEQRIMDQSQKIAEFEKT
jgi:myosin heavy chain 9/10/11/14